ncbi:MAG: hypothetical protein KF718_24555 [Polyangiaceae bacterium]|nr:hypothetical protein [Polyangiaceae bacterium]
MTLKALTFSLCLAGALCIGCGDDEVKPNTVGSGGASSGGSSSGGTGGSIASGGTGGGSAGGAGAPSCDYFGETAGCKTCLQGACCAESAACEANADCKGFVDCARECAEPANTGTQCVQDCAAANNNGGTALNPLILCASNACGTDCSYI